MTQFHQQANGWANCDASTQRNPTRRWKEMTCWEHGWISKTLCWAKGPRHKSSSMPRDSTYVEFKHRNVIHPWEQESCWGAGVLTDVEKAVGAPGCRVTGCMYVHTHARNIRGASGEHPTAMKLNRRLCTSHKRILWKHPVPNTKLGSLGYHWRCPMLFL